MTPEQYAKTLEHKSVPPPQEFKVVPQAVPAGHFSDPVAESAIVVFIGTERWLDIEHDPLRPEDFSVPHWGIIYRAARAIWSKKTVCISSINEWIEENCARDFQRSLGGPTVAWRNWWTIAQDDGGLTSLSNVLDCCERVARYARNRKDYELREAVKEGLPWEQTFERVYKLHGTNGELPEIEDSFKLCQEPDDTPPEIVAGVFHQGSKVMLSGGSKSFKTWQLLQLAVCVSSGHKWLKFNTIKGRVLYLNFELPKWSIRKRINDIRKALSIAPERQCLDVWNLRGHATSGEQILPEIAEIAKRRKYALIVLDPLYKLLGSRDENSASDMSNLMNQIEQITVKTLAAIAFGTHFSKGNQAAKNAIDRMSGSGVLSRDPDAILISTEHKEPNAFSVSMILRNLPAQEDFAMRFSAPIMLVADELDPEELKEPKAGGRPNASQERQDKIMDALAKHGGMLQGQIHEETQIPMTSLKRELKVLIDKRLIFHSEIDSQYAIR